MLRSWTVPHRSTSRAGGEAKDTADWDRGSHSPWCEQNWDTCGPCPSPASTDFLIEFLSSMRGAISWTPPGTISMPDTSSAWYTIPVQTMGLLHSPWREGIKISDLWSMEMEIWVVPAACPGAHGWWLANSVLLDSKHLHHTSAHHNSEVAKSHLCCFQLSPLPVCSICEAIIHYSTSNGPGPSGGIWSCSFLLNFCPRSEIIGPRSTPVGSALGWVIYYTKWPQY